ncbi:MAG: hypothetical protein V1742_03050 [Pseudomonadota bacterium]
MMQRLESGKWLRLMLLLIAGLLCLSVSETQAATREIQPLKEWRGRIDHFIPYGNPYGGYLASQAKLDKLWAEWQIPGKSPQVDFKTQLVLVRTCNCSLISIAPLLNDQGDLKIQMTMTKDLRKDTAYVLVLIPRQGIRTIEGKPIGDSSRAGLWPPLAGGYGPSYNSWRNRRQARKPEDGGRRGNPPKRLRGGGEDGE